MNMRFLSVVLFSFIMGPFAQLATAADIAAGQQVYRHSCAACHGAGGRGTMPGTPDFHRRSGVLSQSDDVLLDRIEHGYRSAGSPNAMPPKGGNPSLTGQDLRNVLAYMRDAFGARSGSAAGKAPPPGEEKNGATAPAGRGMMGGGMMGNGMMGGGMMRR